MSPQRTGSFNSIDERVDSRIMLFLSDNKLWNETNVDRLRKDLLHGYDRFARPANKEVKTPLNISLTILHIDLDETRSVLASHIWLKMKWTDTKLKWDNRSYDGITEIRVNADEVRSNNSLACN